MESLVVALKVDAVGFGILHFSVDGFFGARLRIGNSFFAVGEGAVFPVGIRLVIETFNVVASFADPGVALFFVDWVSTLAKLPREDDLGATHF